MRTTIRIADDLYRAVKAHAAREGRTVAEVIEDAVRVAMSPRSASARDVPPLPTFDHGGTLPGVDISNNAALRDLMDEGVPLDALR